MSSKHLPVDAAFLEDAIRPLFAARAATKTARRLVRRLLERPFGRISRKIRKQIKEADDRPLNRWFDRAATSSTLAGVCAEPK